MFRPRGCKLKRRVKRRHTVYLAERHPKLYRQIAERRTRQIIVAPLDRLQNHDQVLRIVAELVVDDLVKIHKIDFFNGRLRLHTHLVHYKTLPCTGKN